MPLMDTVQKDMVAALKAHEDVKLDGLRMIKAALQKFQIDAMKPHDAASELQVLSTMIKQRKESADMFRKGGRAELAEKEEGEIKLIESYMPASATPEDTEAAVTAAIADTPGASLKQMGLVMKAAQAKLAGKRLDGKALSDLVRSKLS